MLSSARRWASSGGEPCPAPTPPQALASRALGLAWDPRTGTPRPLSQGRSTYGSLVSLEDQIGRSRPPIHPECLIRASSGCPLWNSEPQWPRLGLPILGRRAGRRPLVVGILWVVGREGNMEGSVSPDLHSIPHSQCATATRFMRSGVCGKLGERAGLAIDAGKLKQPDGEPESG